ncbi:hypothetical protein RMSM_03458 [Rhodopirellula maiorica SM1]|uniref:Uncharacterized protein n=2 Tax=Novipirellula TaxID=2795426 RepID=M5RW37_9BACT|nr:hypothetical protein RMSM_03458 [Rhodopirellula maiorica SM1]
MLVPLGLAATQPTSVEGQDFSRQNQATASIDTPQTRLRPIGSPSAVDRYRSRESSTSLRETAYQTSGNAFQSSQVSHDATNRGTYEGSQIRQAMMQQSVTAPQLPPDASPNGGGMGLPPNGFAVPSTPPNNSAPPSGFTPPPSSFTPPPTAQPSAPSLPPSSSATSAPPTSLPAGPNAFSPAPPPLSSGPGGQNTLPYSPNSSSDLTPLAQPELQTEFATMSNSPCISAPSSYTAACASPYMPVSYYAADPCAVPTTLPSTTTIAPAPTFAPAPNVAVAPPAVYGTPITPGTAAPIGSLFTLGQERNLVQVGQGLWGQPVAYVPGQGVRNWIRYFFP